MSGQRRDKGRKSSLGRPTRSPETPAERPLTNCQMKRDRKGQRVNGNELVTKCPKELQYEKEERIEL